MPITKHRNKILQALQEWFKHHDSGPTLEELCQELGMHKKQKATLQRWLQTMRGIDVEWSEHIPRSLRLLSDSPPPRTPLLPLPETLRYLATGLREWEKLPIPQRGQIPETLRIAMSRVYLTSLLQGDNSAPPDLPTFFDWVEQPLQDWSPSQSLKNLTADVRLVESGESSDFTLHWQTSGEDIDAQIQEKILQDVLNHCRRHSLEEEYRHLRKLIITKPVLPYREYQNLLTSTSPIKNLREFLPEIYQDLVKLVEPAPEYHFCPRCNYPQRRGDDGQYRCRHRLCHQLTLSPPLPPLPTLTQAQAETRKAVINGVYRYGTLPGIWELKLATELQQLGLRVTLWPDIDSYDLKVEITNKKHWVIDLKDWSYLNEERLSKTKPCLQSQQTFVVFPDAREEQLRIKVVRPELEAQLPGIKLRLISEVITEAQETFRKK